MNVWLELQRVEKYLNKYGSEIKELSGGDVELKPSITQCYDVVSKLNSSDVFITIKLLTGYSGFYQSNINGIVDNLSLSSIIRSVYGNKVGYCFYGNGNNYNLSWRIEECNLNNNLFKFSVDKSDDCNLLGNYEMSIPASVKDVEAFIKKEVFKNNET